MWHARRDELQARKAYVREGVAVFFENLTLWKDTATTKRLPAIDDNTQSASHQLQPHHCVDVTVWHLQLSTFARAGPPTTAQPAGIKHSAGTYYSVQNFEISQTHPVHRHAPICSAANHQHAGRIVDKLKALLYP
jgi:hypothetical protein